VSEIAAAPRAALLAWNPRARVQPRLAGRAEVPTCGPAWQAAWDATPPRSRRDYAQADPPGLRVAAPPAVPNHPQPERNVAVILLVVDRLDRLGLAPGARERASFACDSGAAHGTWRVP